MPVKNRIYCNDVSIGAGLPFTPLSATIGYSYLQGNASGYTAGYVHVGGGKSIGVMPVSGSVALGIVENANMPEAYSEWFWDVGASMGVGAEYCEWPGGSSATSITLSTEVAGGGVRMDYYILVHSEANGRPYYNLYQKK